MESENFKPIEGLRAYLAFWVAIGHGLQLSGYLSLPTPFSMLLDGWAPVAVFMIVSGFVITHLLSTRKERYGYYITRRFFRLYPAFVFASVIGYFVMGMWSETTAAAPWRTAVGWDWYNGYVHSITNQTYHNTLPHLIAHATMLHSAIPYEILPLAAATFLPAAWSISLEWQFYLVAPLLIHATRNFYAMSASILVFGIGYWATSRGYLGSYQLNAFLPAAIFYFIVGIASRLNFEKLRQARNPIKLVAIAVMVVLAVTSSAPEPLVVWFVFYSLMTFLTHESGLSKLFNSVFSSDYPRFLGTISYSLYLLHRPMQVVLGFAAVSLFEMSRPAMFFVQILAVLLALPVAYLSFEFIERPGIAFGKLMAERKFKRAEVSAVKI